MKLISNFLAVLLLTFCVLLATECISTNTALDGSTEVRTFGAATVTVDNTDGSVTTESAGASEGFVDVLKSVP